MPDEAAADTGGIFAKIGERLTEWGVPFGDALHTCEETLRRYGEAGRAALEGD